MDSWTSREHRCVCGKLIFKGLILEGVVEFKCRYCGRISVVEGILNKQAFCTIILNNDCQIINISESAVRLLGYPRDSLIGHGIETIEEINVNTCRKLFEKIKTVKSILLKTNYKKYNKELIPVNTKVIFFKQREREYALIIFNLIKNESAKRKESSDYGDITAHLDTLGNINFIEMTEEAINLFKYKKEEILQRSVFDFFSEKDKEKKIRNFQQVVAEEKSLRVNNTLITKDGKSVSISSYLIPYYDNFGMFCGFESTGWIK
jgi:PAS domain-containing protein